MCLAPVMRNPEKVDMRKTVSTGCDDEKIKKMKRDMTRRASE